MANHIYDEMEAKGADGVVFHGFPIPLDFFKSDIYAIYSIEQMENLQTIPKTPYTLFRTGPNGEREYFN